MWAKAEHVSGGLAWPHQQHAGNQMNTRLGEANPAYGPRNIPIAAPVQRADQPVLRALSVIPTPVAQAPAGCILATAPG